VARSLGVTGGS